MGHLQKHVHDRYNLKMFQHKFTVADIIIIIIIIGGAVLSP
jgi:hypothetical protein